MPLEHMLSVTYDVKGSVTAIIWQANLGYRQVMR